MIKLLDRLAHRLLRRPKPPRLHRAQIKFRARYPDYPIGLGSYGMPIVHEWHQGARLFIGSYTSIADDVHIFLGGNHRMDWISCFPFPVFVEEAAGISDHGWSKGDVRIGNDVWLGSGCTILSGIAVGDGAVVAARSVVTRNVEPYQIVAGNPAKPIGWRFDESTRMALLDSCWWNWPEAEIRAVVNLLCSNQIENFLVYLKKRNQDLGGENR